MYSAKPFAGRSTAVMISSARKFVSVCGASPDRRWNSANGIRAVAALPRDSNRGFERGERDAISDGWVAMQAVSRPESHVCASC